MVNEKCPACGSINYTSIVYDKLSSEVLTSDTSKELTRSEDSESANKPRKHCTTCGMNYDGGSINKLMSLSHLDIRIGGSRSSKFIYFDGAHFTNVVRYASCHEGEYINLKYQTNKNDLKLARLIKEKIISDARWSKFILELEGLEINHWQRKYVNNDVISGDRWSVNLKLMGEDEIIISGSKKYPPFWNELVAIINKYTSTGFIKIN